ncbi:MAG: hypothetical protein IJU91_10695 [Selenomonadaceae bacterium]|nr:hypothetical protein [Selenomonadaceae bacterium]
MEKPTITINDVEYEMAELTGRAYRIASEFDNNQPQIGDVDFIERHAEVVSKFYPGVTKEDVLGMRIEDILPASLATRRAVYAFTWLKTAEISKNFNEDKEQ